MVMQIEKPEIQRIQVVVRDIITGKSKTMMIYHGTVEEVIGLFEHIINDRARARRPAAGPAA